ncbi:hypothetical protein ACFX2I_022595 [Malus domestica]
MLREEEKALDDGDKWTVRIPISHGSTRFSSHCTAQYLMIEANAENFFLDGIQFLEEGEEPADPSIIVVGMPAASRYHKPIIAFNLIVPCHSGFSRYAGRDDHQFHSSQRFVQLLLPQKPTHDSAGVHLADIGGDAEGVDDVV